MAMETHGCFCLLFLSLSLSLSLSALKIPLNPSKALKGPILPKMPLEAEWTEGLLNESGTD